MLQPGNKILISHRRMFKDDAPRFFVGEVLNYDSGVVKLKGFSFSWDYTDGNLVRKNQSRIKIVSLSAGTVFAYQLPDETNVSEARFESKLGTTMLTDGTGLNMDMAEWPRQGVS